MFRSSNTYAIDVLSEGVKTCKVKWPTDEEWATFFRRRRIVRRQLGGGRTRTEFPDNEKAAGELLAKIRIDDGAPFDEAEADDAINRLAKCELLDVRREGDTFVIEQAIHGGDVTHVLRIPSSKQRRKHENQASQSLDSGRERVTKIFIEPGGALYDAMLVKVEGYDGSVPLIHKAAAVTELFEAIDAALAEPRPEV